MDWVEVKIPIFKVFFILWKNQYGIDSYIAEITRILVKEKFRKRKIVYDIDDYKNIASDFEYSNGEIDLRNK